MTIRGLSKTVLSILISKIIEQLIPICASAIIALLFYLLALSKTLVYSPTYVQYSPVLLSTLLGLTILFGINWWRTYSRHERLYQAYGVLWDKEFKMHCLNCHKYIKYGSHDPSIVHCSDPKCDNKHTLRDIQGQKITEQQAIELIKKLPNKRLHRIADKPGNR